MTSAIDALQHPLADVRMRAILALGRLRTADACDAALVPLAKSHPTRAVAAAAENAVGQT